MRYSIVVVFHLVISMSCLFAQTAIPRMDSVRVVENATLLRNPDAGGFNLPEFSKIDLDLDGIQDLFVFDRSGRKRLTFLNRGTAGQIDFDFAPEYIAAFPSDNADFALCRDFNCDGKADLFIGTSNGIKVYENTSTASLSFRLYADTLLTDYGAGPAFLYILQGDLPDMVDVDGDGDLDLLCFNATGSMVEWHKNMILENTGGCDVLDLVAADRCWGNFLEDNFNQSLTLGINCRTSSQNVQPEKPNAHAGSTLAAFDEEPDGDLELVIGDLVYDGLTYVHNSGTPVDAVVDSFDSIFPEYDASVSIPIFVAGFFLDVDNDGKRDMIVAPNVAIVSANYDNSWFYKNIHQGNGVLLERITKNFLTAEMVDVGMCAYPVLFDHNADGLLDLIVGNYSRKLNNASISSGLALYENTGTSTSPEFTLTTRNYANLANAFIPANFGMTPAFGDLDGDGDKDLIVGDADGYIHFVENTAGPGQLASFPNVTSQYFSIDIGQFATPAIADVDRDGDPDLIVGELSGNLNYFQNTGTPQIPIFSSSPTDAAWGAVDVDPICCTGFSVPFIFENPASGRLDMIVGSETGNLFYYNDLESDLGGIFTVDQTNFGDIDEGQRTAIVGQDLNGNGVWDWIVGNVRGGLGFFEGNGLITNEAESELNTKLDWTIYPNPSTGTVTVKTNSDASGSLCFTICDLQGREILIHDLSSAKKEIELDLSKFLPGIYFLHIDMNGRFKRVKRLVILR